MFFFSSVAVVVVGLLSAEICERKKMQTQMRTGGSWKEETEADGVDLYYVQRKDGTKWEEEREREARNVLETMYAFFGMRLAIGGAVRDTSLRTGGT